VLFSHDKVARGVEYVDASGATREVYADKEVILSAGTIQTPKILFNSGIGPNSILQAFDKPKIYVNEKIGQKIRNQQNFVMTFHDPTLPNANFYSTPDVSLQYAIDGSGILGVAAGVVVSEKVNPAHPHNDVRITAQLLVGASAGLYDQTFSIGLQLEYNVYANGTLNLTSTDPLANTTFTANLFQLEEDIETAFGGLIKAREIIRFWPNATETFPGAEYDTVEELTPLIQQKGSTACHYYGSVPIGNTDESPLDLRMLVRGVRKLRVVDASVIPGEISYGMQAQTAVMALKGASMIIEDHSA